MTRRLRATFVTIVPSPYQRDLFAALARRDEVELDVRYMEAESPDSPWPAVPLRGYEQVMPGTWFGLGGARWHFNFPMPDVSRSDVVILSSYSSTTGQLLLRRRRLRPRLLYWGERLRRSPSPGLRTAAQSTLVAPMGGIAGIVGIGRAATADYSARFPRTRHYCIPYYCDLAAFLAEPRPPADGRPPTFLFCGQMIERKGVDLLLAAFDTLVARGLDIRLLLVGREAELPRFLAAISGAARARIEFAGFQAPEALPPFFARADVFVLPSRHDGWGVVINQALGAGLPIVSSDAAGAGLDLVEEGVNGLRFPAGDGAALARCMETLAQDPGRAAQWGQASRRMAADVSPEAGAERWVQVLRSVAGSP
jgi:glycosyltransferase involved in cell wall biosynthesis